MPYGGYNELNIANGRDPGPVLEDWLLCPCQKRKFFELADVVSSARKKSRESAQAA